MEQNPNTMAARYKAVDAFYRLKSLKKAAKEVDRPVSLLWGGSDAIKRALAWVICPGLAGPHFSTEVAKEWDNIPQHVHSNIYNSIKARLHACIDACGDSTKH